MSIEIEVRNISNADQVRNLPKTKIETVNFDDVSIMRVKLEPGWKWSDCVKPTAGTETCEVPHIQYIISGHLRLRMLNGTEKELRPGDVAVIAPGHDAWVVGNEPVVAIDFVGGRLYGKKD